MKGKELVCTRCKTNDCGKHIKVYSEEINPESWEELCETLGVSKSASELFIPFYVCEQFGEAPKGRLNVCLDPSDFLEESTYNDYPEGDTDIWCITEKVHPTIENQAIDFIKEE